jgi:hypothetical protein
MIGCWPCPKVRMPMRDESPLVSRPHATEACRWRAHQVRAMVGVSFRRMLRVGASSCVTLCAWLGVNVRGCATDPRRIVAGFVSECILHEAASASFLSLPHVVPARLHGIPCPNQTSSCVGQVKARAGSGFKLPLGHWQHLTRPRSALRVWCADSDRVTVPCAPLPAAVTSSSLNFAAAQMPPRRPGRSV